MTAQESTSEREQILEAEVARLIKRLDTLAMGFRVPDGGRYIADWQTRIFEYQRLKDVRAAADAPVWPAEVTNLLPSSEWTSKRYELQSWTGSAFLAGEPVDDERACRQDLYSFLCTLIGYIYAAEEAAQACEALPRPERNAKVSAPEENFALREGGGSR